MTTHKFKSTPAHPDDNRPWVKSDWSYMASVASISVGSPDAGKHAKQQADAAKSAARWTKECGFLDSGIGTLVDSNGKVFHPNHRVIDSANRDKAEAFTLADKAIDPASSSDDHIGKAILKLSRLSARAMQRRALRRGIVLSDAATDDAIGDATLSAWRFWRAVRSARRQPLFTPPVGQSAQWWQWSRRIKRHIRKSVSRSFSGRGFGTVQDCGSPTDPLTFDSLDSFADYWAHAPNPITESSGKHRRTRKLSDALSCWPSKALELASAVLSGYRLSDKDLSYVRVTLHRKGKGWLVRTTDKDTKSYPFHTRVRINTCARMSIRPSGQFERLPMYRILARYPSLNGKANVRLALRLLDTLRQYYTPEV